MKIVTVDFASPPKVGTSYILNDAIGKNGRDGQTVTLVSIGQEIVDYNGIQQAEQIAIFEAEDGTKFKRVILPQIS